MRTRTKITITAIAAASALAFGIDEAAAAKPWLTLSFARPGAQTQPLWQRFALRNSGWRWGRRAPAFAQRNADFGGYAAQHGELGLPAFTKVAEQRFSEDDYRRAMKTLMAVGMGLPSASQVRTAASIVGALKDDPAFASKIDHPMWLMTEMYLMQGKL